jgi:hypothetical protein
MKGTVVYLFAFDIANEIRTGRVREVLSKKPFPFQIRVGATAPKDVPIYTPLTVALPPTEAESTFGKVPVHVFVKIFDVGVLSISYEVPFETDALSRLVPLHAFSIGGEPLAARAEQLAARVSADLKDCCIAPNPDRAPVEAYTVFCVHDPGEDPQGWLSTKGREIAALLNEEPDAARLAEGQVAETLRTALTYTREDLAVVDWDAALVVDRSGYVDDVLYMIELANLQLEEYRLLDERLDRISLEAYDRMEKPPGMMAPPDPALARLRRMRIDITKMSEELSNITKFVGDWYLARVYLACKDRFHLGHWENTVDQKLLELDRLYSLMRQDVTEKRMLVLEITIVALFILDLLTILWKR